MAVARSVRECRLANADLTLAAEDQRSRLV